LHNLSPWLVAKLPQGFVWQHLHRRHAVGRRRPCDLYSASLSAGSWHPVPTRTVISDVRTSSNPTAVRARGRRWSPSRGYPATVVDC
jgi:hypothetical protein